MALKKDWNYSNTVSYGTHVEIKPLRGNPFISAAIVSHRMGGACAAYSALWCRRTLKLQRAPRTKDEFEGPSALEGFSVEPVTRPTPAIVAAEASQAWLMRQDMKGRVASEFAAIEQIMTALSLTVRIVGSKATTTNPFVDWVTTALTKDGVYYVSLYFKDEQIGAHAVAIMTANGRCTVFDARGGQDSGTVADLRTLLKGFAAANPVDNWIVAEPLL